MFGIIRALRGQACNKIECLPPHLQSLAYKYRNAIAEVLGVPPEAIREDIVVRWVKDWAEAYVKPEYRQMVRAKIYGDYITVKKKTVHY